MATQKQTLNNKVTEAWQVDDYFAEINGVIVCENDMVDFEVVWGGQVVNSVFTFMDTKGFASGDKKGSKPITAGGFVDISFNDFNGCNYQEEYVITKVSVKNNNKQQKMIILEMEDKDSRNMKGSFVSTGHPDKKFSDVQKDQQKELQVKSIEVVGPKEEDKVNITVPAHISYFDYLTKELPERGYELIRDKKNSYMVHNEHRDFDKLKKSEEVYEFDAKQFSPFRIVQYDIDGFNMSAYLDSIPTTVTNIDPISNNTAEKKEGNKSEVKKDKPEDSQTSKVDGTPTTDLIASRGEKQVSLTGQEKQYYSQLSNAQKATIWVPGRNINRAGMKIEVSFPRPRYYDNSEYDKIFSGEWEVKGYRDKVIGQYFMQELQIRRPGGK